MRWAFTRANAGSRSTLDHYRDLAELDRIDWGAVRARDFRAPEVKEGKQAEFLLHGGFPWHLVETIGVSCQAIRDRVGEILAQAGATPGQPLVAIRRAWYY